MKKEENQRTLKWGVVWERSSIFWETFQRQRLKIDPEKQTIGEKKNTPQNPTSAVSRLITIERGHSQPNCAARTVIRIRESWSAIVSRTARSAWGFKVEMLTCASIMLRDSVVLRLMDRIAWGWRSTVSWPPSEYLTLHSGAQYLAHMKCFLLLGSISSGFVPWPPAKIAWQL